MNQPYPYTSRYVSGHENPAVDAVVKVVQDWFDALENGIAVSRLPDLRYPKQWDDKQLDDLIDMIDMEYTREAQGWARTAYKIECGPEFFRLEPLQRLAFIQDLHRVIEEHREVLEKMVESHERPIIDYDTVDYAQWYV